MILGPHVQNCTLFDNTLNGYDDEECNTKSCFSCDFEQEVYFRLKGICAESSKIDSDYLLKFDAPKLGNFYFRGFAGLTSISYYEPTRKWVILSYRLNGTDALLGFFNDTTTVFPIGLQNWYMYSTCEITYKEPDVVKLKLTQVPEL